jgi:hypothetical protein
LLPKLSFAVMHSQRLMVFGKFPHKLSKHLCRRFILRTTHFQELFAKISLNAYSQTYVFHNRTV